MKKEEENTLWCEKYRPTELSNYIGNNQLKTKVQSFIESGDIPHLLFFGKAGGGKTTLAKLITKSINCDVIIINASDENNVETIRNKVKGFASTQSFSDGKIVILDEFDYMTVNAQALLRNLMETFSNNCRFILTCNYIEKVIEPIQSRCQTFEILPPDKNDVIIHISKILEEENVSFQLEDVSSIIDCSFPDLRKIINTIQLTTINGVLDLNTDTLIETEIKSKLLSILKSPTEKNNKWSEIRKLVSNSRVKDFTELYSFLYEKVDEYGGNNTPAIILILTNSLHKETSIMDKEIVFISCIIEITQL